MHATENPFKIKKLTPHYVSSDENGRVLGKAVLHVYQEEIVEKVNEIIEALNGIEIGILK